MTLHIPPTDIIIGERQRVELGDLSDLNSMSDPDVGQILPIIIDTNRKLIDGRRRLEKALQLNWTTVRVEVQAEVSEISKQKKELFADVGRKDRTWQEKVKSVAKLHRLIAAEKADEGIIWTVRAMAMFTGLNKTGVANMLRVASQMEAHPDMAAQCGSFDEALTRLVIEPSEKVALDELNRRAALNSQALASDVPTMDKTKGEESTDSDWLEPSSPADPITIRLWGYNVGFSKPTLQKHKAALIWNPPSDDESFFFNLFNSMADEGCVVVWFPSMLGFESWQNYFEDVGFHVQPWPLIWSKITLNNNGGWPFSPNYNIGLVLIKTDKPDTLPRLALNPSTSTIACLHSDETPGLPSAVVTWTLKAICQYGDHVLLPCNSPLIETADCGNVPMWFEADKAVYDEKLKQLTEFYQERHPGCTVK